MTAPTTLAAQWSAAVAARPDASFLVFERSDRLVNEWTYHRFDELVTRVAVNLLGRGVGPDRGVHLVLRNSPSFVAAWIAAIRLGSFVVPSDPAATTPELAEHMRRTSPAVSVVGKYRRRVAEDAAAMLDDPPYLVGVDEDDPGCRMLAAHGVDPSSPPFGAWPEPSLRDRAAVMFTSGTTGRPKGVEITQANYAFAGSTMAAAAGLGADDRQLVVLPLFHANAQYYSFASAIAVGASVALMHTFSASRFLEQAARYRATHASLFAGPMRMILARAAPPESTERAPGTPLRHCWFAQNITAEQHDTLTDWFGCRPRQLYGMTETIPAVLTDSADDARHDSMGFVTDGCAVDVHDADGDSVAPGEVGDVVVGGERGISLFAGYLDDPATTEASFRGGWFLTGDRARRDPEGRYFFDGRRSDVLKVAGENVSVVEVESVVGDHPDVFDVVVVGAPDPIRDEVPVAFVVLEPGAENDGVEQRLSEWCEARLAKAKRPQSYTIVEELPRTSVGKVRKFLLSEAASASQQPGPGTASTTSKERPS